jgi:class 3 adenylate cyclase/DNA-binding CsgD family transcriptional regulator/tetratricopeptide (TPR) repeat protein
MSPTADRDLELDQTSVVTILFTDLVASTETMERVGDERAEELRRAHFRLVRDAAASHGGRTVKSLGDGLMIVFASAVEAVLAAGAIQAAVATTLDDDPRADGRVRVGLHVGEPIRDEGDYFGRPVVLARRLCDAAGPGQILASDLVRNLVKGRSEIEFRPLGRRTLKGIGEPVDVYEVAWEKRASAPSAATPLDPRSLDLVGRATEMAELEMEYACAEAGELRAVLLLGDGGLGKTRLAGELVRRRQNSAVCLSARAYPLGATASLGLWVEALEQHLRSLEPAAVAELCGSSAEDLAALLPSVAATNPSLAIAPPPLVRQLAALANLLARLSEATPVVIILDDVHLADGSSWEALNYLTRNLADRRILIVLAARPVELSESPVGSEVLLALEQEGVLRRFPIAALRRDDVARLAQRFVDSAAVGPRVVDWLMERSQGSPLYAIGLLRALLDEGADLSDPRLQSLPEDLAERVTARLKVLGPVERATLELVAVLGYRVELSDLEHISDRDLDSLGDALRELVRLRFIHEEDLGREVLYEIVHPLFQEAIYAGIGAARRRALHRHAARSLVQSGRLGAAAQHFVRSSSSGDPEAVDALRGALRQAEALEHHRESIGLLSALLEMLPQGDRRWLDVFDALDWQAEWVVEHRLDAGLEVAIRAMRTIEQLAAASDDRVRRAAVKFHLASFLAWGRGDTDAAIALVTEAQGLFEAAGEPRRALLAANEMGYLRSIAGDLGAHERIARRVLADAEALDDGPVMLQAICSLNWALQLSGRVSESLELMQRGLALARREGRPYRITYLLAQQGYALALLGRIPEARTALADAVAANSAYLDTLLPDFAATIHWLAGDLHDAVAAMRQSVGMGATETSQRRMMGVAVAAVAATEVGDTVQMNLLHELLAATKRGDWWAHSDQVTWAFGIREWGRHDLVAATRQLTAATRRMVDTGAGMYARIALFDLAEVALEASDPQAAATVEVSLDHLGDADGAPLRALDTASRAATGMCAGRGVDTDALDAAAAELRRCGWNLHHARVLVIAGRALVGTDNPAAIDRWTEATAVFAACDAGVRREACLQLLDRLGPRGKRARTATSGPGALTSRELEVARLAVEGLATREIGERLFIGRRTVETHLTNAYAKLGVRSRVELVRIADQFSEPATP